jgi:hypothetical protein
MTSSLSLQKELCHGFLLVSDMSYFSAASACNGHTGMVPYVYNTLAIPNSVRQNSVPRGSNYELIQRLLHERCDPEGDMI